MTADLASALAEQEERLSHCVHCGFCLPVCPTYVRLRDENDSPRGRLHLMRAVAAGRLQPSAGAFTVHMDRCLGCRACETVCPSGVEYGFLLERARGAIVERTGQSLSTRLLLGVFSSPRPRRFALALGRVLRASRIPAWVSRILPDLGWLRGARLGLGMLEATREVDVLPGAASPPTGGSGSGEGDIPALKSPVEKKGRVGVLAGCVQDGLLRRVNEATRRVLEVNGWEVVEVSGQDCCGALHAHSGDLAGARALAGRNVEAFRREDLDFIVVNAAGCGATMKEYGELVEEDRSTAEGVATRVRDLAEILMATGVRGGGPIRGRVTLDHPCHLVHAQGIRSEPADVLRAAVPGIEIIPLRDADECCGGAGIYGITHPDLGGRIGADKIEAILETGAEVVLSPNPGCMMQIGAGLHLRGSHVRVLHPVELLDRSYRTAGLYDA